MSRAEVLKRLKEIEADQLGMTQAPLGSNRIKYNTSFYGKVVKGPEFKWCAVFQWWCFQKAGIPTTIFPKSARVFAIRDWYKKRGRFYHQPMVGDLVIYSFSHIGFVEKLLKNNRIQTIEGNVNDRVVRRIRSANSSSISGYCRPQYSKVGQKSAPPPPPPTDRTTEEIVRALPRLKRNDKGADVRRLQGLIVANGHALKGSTKSDGTFDGTFGEETERELVKLTGSKVVDDAQWKKLLGV
jgi:hypothetical protein